MPYLEVAGWKAYYALRRSLPTRQPPVLFVHGAGGTHQHWLYQVRDLAPSPTYTLDLPGHGRSEGPGQDTIEAYSDWLIAFLDAAELERVVLVGHSMGGAIALDAAMRHSGRVMGLGWVATGARLRVAPAILDSIREDKEAAVELICDAAFGPEAPSQMKHLGRRQMGATDAEALYGDFAACDAIDVRDRLGGLEAPACIVCGTFDSLTPAKYSVYLRDHLPCARLHLVEGAGHMVMIERPAAMVGFLKAFLDTLSLDSSPPAQHSVIR
jgi:pimeloyl-ACP methyl ester carboxylesterase